MINETKQNSSFSGLNNTGDETYYYGSDGDDGTGNYYQPLEYYYFYAKKYEYVEDWEIPIRGYVTFFVALITILTNMLLISVFIFRSSRSPTSVVLTSLAISDSIICMTRLPEAIYFNMAKNYQNLYVTYRWCIANHVLYIIYQIFRMTSNWCTALLGTQRLLAVALPFKYNRICSNRATIIEIAVIVTVSFLLNLYKAFGIYIAELPIYTNYYHNESLPSSCVRHVSRGLINAFGDTKTSDMIFYIFYGLLNSVLPVAVLLFTTVMLLYLLYTRQKIGPAVTQKKAQLERTTVLLCIILVIFLIAEIQDGVAYFIYADELSGDDIRIILSKETDMKWITISSLLSLLSYACNFWIFFFMSQQFRSALLDMFRSGLRKANISFVLEASEDQINRTCCNAGKNTNTETQRSDLH
ncbi:sex peptide receptor-like [Ostrea edulis]|uniref:sex peptide receptor-like n=1 Tax=Ostrea edulis TaxID=37623 RepID=UPI0024AFDA17|nr:sex peptide receptor-like [Ostrea edulis]